MIEDEANDSEGKWWDNTLQFPRLIAEAEAAGAFTVEIQEAMAVSMDLTVDRVCALIDRGQREWDNIINST